MSFADYPATFRELSGSSIDGTRHGLRRSCDLVTILDRLWTGSGQAHSGQGPLFCQWDEVLSTSTVTEQMHSSVQHGRKF